MSQWDLSVFYPDFDAWQKDVDLFESRIDEFSAFKGKLNTFEGFRDYILLEEEISHLLYKVYPYAHLAADLNLRDNVLGSKYQSVLLKLSRMTQVTSFFSPEVIAAGKDLILSFVEKDERLKPYRFVIEKLFHQQEHVLSDDNERILAFHSPIFSVPTSMYNALAVGDRTDEEVQLSTGEKMKITQSNYRAILPTLKNPADRQLVFEAAFKRYKDNKNAFANLYNLVLQNMAASYKSRGYKSALEGRLFGNNIPVSVFMNLKDVAYENVGPIKRYIKLRQKYLGLDKYRTYDRFLKLAESNIKYPYEQARQMFFEALEGLDPEFVKNERRALEDGYVDVSPKDGKRTGAYSSGFYGWHPFILLNHDETLDSVFTLAHEAGHSAHTIFSNEAQPMAIADYVIFVAEIASTFNEHLLGDYLLSKATTKEEKIVLLENEIDGIMATFFRQTLFATYEYEANKLVEQGIPITEATLSKIMIDLYKHYYDIDITEENGKQYVWAYIPHLFHTPFYVYQYATSYSASLKIYENVKKGLPNAMSNYIQMLKAGGSAYPVDIAKIAGADLTDKQTFLAVINRFNELIDQLEDVLKS
ncbi:oligoendopeptidase F [Acholeplasma vituli]|uniref:Oligopeptidase F n=1 Tax=Paracholeplasma vituli TaxID=69473 RepID=A0ABT2Q0I8_9MOLU|nr:oligoendopeptidase F [Paracholeplasma vituli]MCU0105428.1 oligoendopeptidase F [Paracholeplasma vituli]